MNKKEYIKICVSAFANALLIVLSINLYRYNFKSGYTIDWIEIIFTSIVIGTALSWARILRRKNYVK